MAASACGSRWAIGVALAAKAAGIDAGGWFDEAIARTPPQVVSHEHTFSVDVSDREMLETNTGKAGRESLPPASRTRAACPPHYSSSCALPTSAPLPGPAR